jgi:hypothetical protein
MVSIDEDIADEILDEVLRVIGKRKDAGFTKLVNRLVQYTR